MKPRVVHVRTSNTSEEQSVYFDKDVFSLLDTREVENKEDGLCKKIAKLLLQKAYNFPVYVYSVSYNINTKSENVGDYNLVLVDSQNNILTPSINFTIRKIIDVNTSANPLCEDEKTPDPLVENYTFLPIEIYDSTKIKVKTDYIEPKVRAKETQYEDFVAGKITLPFIKPEEPELMVSPFSEETFNFEDAANIMPNELGHVVPVLEKARNAKLNLDTIERDKKDKLAKVNNPFIKNKIEKAFFPNDLNLTQIERNFAKQEKTINELENKIKEDCASACVNYQIAQQQFSNFKNKLAWVIYIEAGKCYQKIQETNKDRKSNIDSFNKCFLNLVRIRDDGMLSDIEDVYKEISQQKSLADVKKLIDKLLAATNKAGFAETNEFVSEINKVAKEFGNLPFSAEEKQLHGFIPPVFNWGTNVLVLERQTDAGIKVAKEKIISESHHYTKRYEEIAPKSMILGQIITPLSTIVTTNYNTIESEDGLRARYNRFSAYMEDYFSLLNKLEETFKQKNELDTQINILKANIDKSINGFENFKKKDVSEKYKTEKTDICSEINTFPNQEKQELYATISTTISSIKKLQSVIESTAASLEPNHKKRQTQLTNLQKETHTKIDKELTDLQSYINKLENLKTKAEIIQLEITVLENQDNETKLKDSIDEKYKEINEGKYRIEDEAVVNSNDKLKKDFDELNNSINAIKILQIRYSDGNTEKNVENDRKMYLENTKNVLRLHSQINNEIHKCKQFKTLLKTFEEFQAMSVIYEKEISKLKLPLNDDFVKWQQETYIATKDNINTAFKLFQQGVQQNILDVAETYRENLAEKMLINHLAFLALQEYSNLVKFKEDLSKLRQQIPNLESLQTEINKYSSNVLNTEINNYKESLQSFKEYVDSYHNKDYNYLFENSKSLSNIKQQAEQKRNELFAQYDKIKHIAKINQKFGQFQTRIETIQASIKKYDDKLPELLKSHPNEKNASKHFTQFNEFYNAAKKEIQTIAEKYNTDINTYDIKHLEEIKEQEDTISYFFEVLIRNYRKIEAISNYVSKSNELKLSKQSEEIHVIKANNPPSLNTKEITRNKKIFIENYNLLISTIKLMQSKKKDLEPVLKINPIYRTDIARKNDDLADSLTEIRKFQTRIKNEIIDKKDFVLLMQSNVLELDNDLAYLTSKSIIKSDNNLNENYLTSMMKDFSNLVNTHDNKIEKYLNEKSKQKGFKKLSFLFEKAKTKISDGVKGVKATFIRDKSMSEYNNWSSVRTAKIIAKKVARQFKKTEKKLDENKDAMNELYRLLHASIVSLQIKIDSLTKTKGNDAEYRKTAVTEILKNLNKLKDQLKSDKTNKTQITFNYITERMNEFYKCANAFHNDLKTQRDTEQNAHKFKHMLSRARETLTNNLRKAIGPYEPQYGSIHPHDNLSTFGISVEIKQAVDKLHAEFQKKYAVLDDQAVRPQVQKQDLLVSQVAQLNKSEIQEAVRQANTTVSNNSVSENNNRNQTNNDINEDTLNEILAGLDAEIMKADEDANKPLANNNNDPKSDEEGKREKEEALDANAKQKYIVNDIDDEVSLVLKRKNHRR